MIFTTMYIKPFDNGFSFISFIPFKYHLKIIYWRFRPCRSLTRFFHGYQRYIKLFQENGAIRFPPLSGILRGPGSRSNTLHGRHHPVSLGDMTEGVSHGSGRGQSGEVLHLSSVPVVFPAGTPAYFDRSRVRGFCRENPADGPNSVPEGGPVCGLPAPPTPL
jgi:hypothetical protein